MGIENPLVQHAVQLFVDGHQISASLFAVAEVIGREPMAVELGRHAG